MTMTSYGPDNTCERTACVNLPPHKAGRHLDQRDELYDGPSSLLQILPLAVRDSARKIVREAPDLMPEAVDLAKHIEWLREQVASVRVNSDRAVREALKRSEDCAAHGEDIKALERQLAALDADRERTEKARLTLLGLLHAIDDLVIAHKSGRVTLNLDSLIESLAEATRKTHNAHQRVWTR